MSFQIVSASYPQGTRLYPSHQLNSPKLKQALTEYLLHPLTQHPSTQQPPDQEWNIHAFKIVWGLNQSTVDEDMWNELVRRRMQVDEHLSRTPEVGFFLSAITASYSHVQSKKKKVAKKPEETSTISAPNRQHTVKPILAYWMYVLPGFNMVDLHQDFQPLLEGGLVRNPLMEDVNNPEGFNEAGILHALHFACKDYKNTFISRKVLNSALWCTGFVEHPVIKLVVTNPGLMEQIQNAHDELSKLGLNSMLECRVQNIKGTDI